MEELPTILTFGAANLARTHCGLDLLFSCDSGARQQFSTAVRAAGITPLLLVE